jgi:hypothetical protein
VSELEFLNSQLDDIKKKIADERVYECNRKAAEDLRKTYNAFIAAGFTDEQAWWLTGQMFLKAIGANNV